jgi:ribosomal protein S18 acetylase RimI-like enzyme
MEFRFTNDYPVTKLDEIVSFMLGPRLWIPKGDYPDFLDWADRTYKELKKESKRVMLALHYQNVIGAAVYQKHKKISDALEIKNLTVRPDMRGRYIASFLLRNAEVEGGKEFHSQYVLCDAKSRNMAVRYFLFKNRYRALRDDDLYKLGSGEDTIYRKNLIFGLRSDLRA